MPSCIAEYRALIYALQYINQPAEIFSDCMEMVLEVNDAKNINPDHMVLLYEARELLKKKNCTLRWISRNKNPAGIYLEQRLEKLHGYMDAVLKPHIGLSNKERKRRRF